MEGINQWLVELNKNSPVWFDVVEALNSLKYGEVVITVHNSKIVQIDKTEKKRFDRQQDRRCK